MKGRGSKAFYERLCEVAPKWMDSDPAREGSRMLFDRLFVGQLAPAFRKKLQNRGEVEGMVIPQVMPVRIGEEVEENEKSQEKLLNPLSGQARGRGRDGFQG